MDEPKSLDSLFKEKIFRIPDYQRGYAWQPKQLKDFWEDLVNLSGDRLHYTGVLTLTEIGSQKIKESDNEYWLVDEHSYKMYHVVDGQQRLTTFIIFVQAFIDFVKQLDENVGKPDEKIYITETLNVESVIERYLFKIKPTGNRFRTYKFGYEVDNPSYEYLRYKIFDEAGAGEIKETFYTLNLRNAKHYFYEQIKGLYDENGLSGLQEIYKKLTRRFLFNEYVIKDEFDVFVAFETMNNRGKNLSDLELLKNRLIYLTTLYTKKELERAERRSLRDAINKAWKEVYRQLGRNDKQPLNDDDFLKAHWIMYFKLTKKKGDDYIKFLLDEQFSPRRVHKKVPRKVALELPEEQRADSDIDDTENENDDTEESASGATDRLQTIEIEDYVNSLKESAVHWFNSYYPYLATELSQAEQEALDRLNRIRIGYFRPLVMSILKNEENTEKRLELLNDIERFIFIVFRLCRANSNYSESIFWNASRDFDSGGLSSEGIKEKLDTSASHCFDEDGMLNFLDFAYYLDKKFTSGGRSGFYGWNGLEYFLYEYELSLHSQSCQKKVSWEDFHKTSKDKVSIEHIFPQTPTDTWKSAFSDVDKKDYMLYSGSIGNLLLLSKSINSSLQNDSFEEKKNPKMNSSGEKIRNGYSDGSHSEIEVSQKDKWDSAAIEERGLKLLTFMEQRWKFKFGSDVMKRLLLFLTDNSKFFKAVKSL